MKEIKTDFVDIFLMNFFPIFKENIIGWKAQEQNVQL